MKRLSLRSICASRSMSGTPATWLRMPSSAYSGTKEMPGFSSRRDAVTLALSLPRHEPMPLPVTTTRLPDAPAISDRATSVTLRRSKQAHAQVVGDVDLATIDQRAAVGDHQCELAAHHATDVDLVADKLRVRVHLAAEF